LASPLALSVLARLQQNWLTSSSAGGLHTMPMSPER
jgi:hypothetical protein